MESARDYKNRVGCHEFDASLSGAAVMRNTIRIEMPAYLQGLYRAVQSLGQERATTVKWTCKTMNDASDVDSASVKHDIVIVSSGVGVVKHWTSWSGGPDQDPPLKFVRGQNLIFRDREDIKLSESLLCGEYVVPCESYIIAGATHEYESWDVLLAKENIPDKLAAISLLKDKLSRLHPTLATRTPTDCNAGVRVVAKRTHEGKLPLIASSADQRRWLLTGFGSRGVIHHALYAKMLVDALKIDF